jgi:hypothetical protein
MWRRTGMLVVIIGVLVFVAIWFVASPLDQSPVDSATGFAILIAALSNFDVR